MKRDFSLFKEEIRGKKVAVVGIGVSNIPLIRFLIRLGAHVTAFDRRDFQRLDPQVEEFRDQVEFSLGEDYLTRLSGYDFVFRTPGMRPDVPELERARAEGAIVTSEMKEFLRHCPATTIGITGSDGKSTTTTISHGMLSAQGYKARIGGNIGFPLFDQIEEIGPEEYVVLELSSFQLMDMETSPDIAIVTNLSPNHLDVHTSLEEYKDAKKNIFRYQDANGILILNEDNEVTRSFKPEAKGQIKTFSSKQKADAWYADDWIYLRGKAVMRLSEMKIRGIHNAENLCAALLATEGLVDLETVRAYMREFPGVKHRAQFVAEKRGARWYNDSIASSPTRTLATLRSLKEDHGRIDILLGGKDKNLDYHDLAREAGPWLRNIILVGESKEKIRKAFMESGGEASERILDADTFEEAVELAARTARPGDLVILSPACASFDMFDNFEKRGDRFRDLVLAMD